MEALEAIKTRRSIRKYKPDPIDDKTLDKVLEAARWAPSWANTQCRRFIVVRNSQTKEELAGTLSQGNGAIPALLSAPVAIVACAKLGRAGYSSKDHSPMSDKGDWFMFDVGLTMQNLILAAHAQGLGTVVIGAFDAKKVAEVLEVPEGFCVVTLTPLGYPDQEPVLRPRKELSEIVFYDKFGNAGSV